MRARIPRIEDLKLGSEDSEERRRQFLSFLEDLVRDIQRLLPVNVSAGEGSPEGVVVGDKGDLYLNRGVGDTLWVKETNGGNTGWVAK